MLNNLKIKITILMAFSVMVGVALVATGATIAFSLSIYGVLLSLLGGILLGITTSYLLISLGTVKADEVAMESEFDKPVKNLGKGLFFAPKGVVSVRKEKGTVFQNELPADPEKIFREEGKVPDGMYPPIRIKFGQPDPADTNLKDDPYNVPMVAEVVPVVSWQITDPITFFTTMGTVENCRQNLADKAVGSFGEDLAKVTPAKASLKLNELSAQLKADLVVATTTWGITIKDGFIKPFIYSHGLNKAVEGVSIAQEGAKAAILTSEGDKVKEINRATAAAEAVRLATAAEKNRLIELGLVKTDDTGKVTELVPSAETKARTDALKELAKHKGALVFGGNTNTMLGIDGKEN